MALFELKNVKYPASLTTDTEFKITGDVTLFGIPWEGLAWALATVTYPRKLLEPAPPKKSTGAVVFLGKFTINFGEGFNREGEYKLDINLYGGPTVAEPLGPITSVSMTLPPFPAVASLPTKTFVIGETPEEAITKVSIVYNNNQPDVVSGEPVPVAITVTNSGTQSITPRFRVDIQGTSALDTPLEGDWVVAPTMEAGQTVSFTAESIAIPTDWQNGKTLHVYLMLEGLTGHWDEAPVLLTVAKGVGTVSKESVVYNDNETGINSGEVMNVQISWKNIGVISMTPRFRLDIQGTGTFDTPMEGTWVTSPAAAPGQTIVFNAHSIPIPTDWQNGKTLHAFVVLEGYTGHWDDAPALFSVLKGGIGSITKVSIIYNNNQNTAKPGVTIPATVTFRNDSSATMAPRFRLDIQGTGTFDTVLEGTWFTSQPVLAGQIATITIQSVPVPSNWQNGKTFNAYVMLEGVSGHWDVANILFTVVKGTGSITKISVVYNNNQSSINSGSRMSVQITWRNDSNSSSSPQFRVDIEGTGAFDTPIEGSWVASPVAAPGQTVTVTAQSVPIPTDWQNGKTLHAYTMLNGVGGHWDEASTLFTVVKTTINPTLVVTNSPVTQGTNLLFRASGFSPNTSLTVWVQDRGGATWTTDASGSVYGGFQDNDPPGNYTLIAQDSYGHRATTTFAVQGTTTNPRVTASYNAGIVSYNYSGFPPYVVVYISVGSSPRVPSTANSSGSGSGSFYYTLSHGTYTVKAEDAYGHSATTTITVT